MRRGCKTFELINTVSELIIGRRYRFGGGGYRVTGTYAGKHWNGNTSFTNIKPQKRSPNYDGSMVFRLEPDEFIRQFEYLKELKP
jgi:hypothetical protein